jgi:hypothetical protein
LKRNVLISDIQHLQCLLKFINIFFLSSSTLQSNVLVVALSNPTLQSNVLRKNFPPVPSVRLFFYPIKKGGPRLEITLLPNLGPPVPLFLLLPAVGFYTCGVGSSVFIFIPRPRLNATFHLTPIHQRFNNFVNKRRHFSVRGWTPPPYYKGVSIDPYEST